MFAVAQLILATNCILNIFSIPWTSLINSVPMCMANLHVCQRMVRGFHNFWQGRVSFTFALFCACLWKCLTCLFWRIFETFFRVFEIYWRSFKNLWCVFENSWLLWYIKNYFQCRFWRVTSFLVFAQPLDCSLKFCER